MTHLSTCLGASFLGSRYEDYDEWAQRNDDWVYLGPEPRVSTKKMTNTTFVNASEGILRKIKLCLSVVEFSSSFLPNMIFKTKTFQF